jgi:hypothetical protein
MIPKATGWEAPINNRLYHRLIGHNMVYAHQWWFTVDIELLYILL